MKSAWTLYHKCESIECVPEFSATGEANTATADATTARRAIEKRMTVEVRSGRW